MKLQIAIVDMPIDAEAAMVPKLGDEPFMLISEKLPRYRQVELVDELLGRIDARADNLDVEVALSMAALKRMPIDLAYQPIAYSVPRETDVTM